MLDDAAARVEGEDVDVAAPAHVVARGRGALAPHAAPARLGLQSVKSGEITNLRTN